MQVLLPAYLSTRSCFQVGFSSQASFRFILPRYFTKLITEQSPIRGSHPKGYLSVQQTPENKNVYQIRTSIHGALRSPQLGADEVTWLLNSTKSSITKPFNQYQRDTLKDSKTVTHYLKTIASLAGYQNIWSHLLESTPSLINTIEQSIQRLPTGLNLYKLDDLSYPLLLTNLGDKGYLLTISDNLHSGCFNLHFDCHGKFTNININLGVGEVKKITIIQEDIAKLTSKSKEQFARYLDAFCIAYDIPIDYRELRRQANLPVTTSREPL